MKRTVDPTARMLQALGDPVRLAIVRGLAGHPEVCACDFARFTGVSQPTVSHHLRVLREAGVVRSERRGTWIFYALEDDVAERLREFAALLTPTEARPASFALVPELDDEASCTTGTCANDDSAADGSAVVGSAPDPHAIDGSAIDGGAIDEFSVDPVTADAPLDPDVPGHDEALSTARG